MISEPELDGGTGFATAELLPGARPPRPPRARRPWAWVLGGAVLASAVWGGALLAYERRREPGPDLRGYRAPLGDGLCPAAKLKALGDVLGRPGEHAAGRELDDPAVYETSCDTVFGPAETGYRAGLTYTVHKVTDPGPEFAARAKDDDLDIRIDGVGDQAFFNDREGEGGVIRVLDGQTEIELSVYRQYATDARGNVVEETAPMDLSGIEVPMSQDVLALMAALRK